MIIADTAQVAQLKARMMCLCTLSRTSSFLQMLMLSRTTRTPLFSPEKKYFVTAARMPYIIENFRCAQALLFTANFIIVKDTTFICVPLPHFSKNAAVLSGKKVLCYSSTHAVHNWKFPLCPSFALHCKFSSCEGYNFYLYPSATFIQVQMLFSPEKSTLLQQHTCCT